MSAWLRRIGMAAPRVLLAVVVFLLLAACNGEADEAMPTPTPADPTPPADEPEPTPDEPTPEPTPEPDATPEPDPATPDLGAVSVTLTQVASLASPTAGAAGPGGTVWITERPGRVRVLDDGDVSDPVLDVTADTTTGGERGLLGIAFDDGHAHLYLSYTNPAGDTRVDEWRMDGDRPDPGSRRTVITQEQPFSNHNGGDITIGPDGMLWLGLGDGGGAGDPIEAGQDNSTLLGTLVRVDPRGGDPYGIPDDNPFLADAGARDEIWAYGLRNPWRFSFDAATGDLWIADVGQDAREEVNVVPAGEGAGANFGWNLMEGTREFAGSEPADHWPPVFEYDTTRARCAITGGYVYRGEAIPDLAGAYVYSDFCEGVVRAVDVRDGQLRAEADLGVNGGSVVSFAQGPDRELYVLDLGGAVWRLDPA